MIIVPVTTRFRSNLLAIATMSALLPVVAHAQEEAADDRANGSDIVVTATRTQERLSRVPVSVTAFNQAKLDEQGVRGIQDVAQLTPGVVFTSTGFAGNNQIAIRGIASSVGASTTGIYIDDTPIQVRAQGFASATAYPEVFDLARVEILRGPQGTLFGAGSQGGTVRFITPDPAYDRLHVYGRGEVSATQDGSPSYEAGVAVGMPLVEEQLGLRASVWYRRGGGYIDQVSNIDGSRIKNDINARTAFTARLALGARLGDHVTITPSVYYQETKENGPSTYISRLSDPGSGRFVTANPTLRANKDYFVLPSLKAEIDLGDVTLTSVTSKFIRTGKPFQDYSLTFPGLLLGPEIFKDNLFIAGFPEYALQSGFRSKQNNFTQEIRLAYSNPGSRLTAQLGFFLQRARQTTEQSFYDPQLPQLLATFFGGATVSQIFGVPMIDPVTSYYSRDFTKDNQDAVFGEISYKITDRLKLTAGARYGKTSVHYDAFQTGPWAGGTVAATGDQSEKPFTPKFGISYDIDSRNMLYATAAKGFRVGGANKPIPVTNDLCAAELDAFGLTPAVGPYKSDSVWSYEVGSKSNGLLNGRLQLYTSAYYIEWKNIQQSLPLSNCGFNFIGNLGSAVSKGADIQVQFQLTDDLQLNGSVAYNHATLTNSVFAAPDQNGVRASLAQEGNALPSSPWMITLTANYEREFAKNKELYANVTYSYRADNKRLSPNQDPRNLSYSPDVFLGESTHLVNMRLGARLDKVDLSLFANNVFNATPILTRDNSANGFFVFNESTFTPRTIGVTGLVNF